MWWPNGYGDQPLYQLTVTWMGEDTTETSSKRVKVGFRTVELNQDLVDHNDTSKGEVYSKSLTNAFITQCLVFFHGVIKNNDVFV